MHIKRQHEGIKEFKCNSCEYAAYTAVQLKRHIKSIHNHTVTDQEEMKGNIITKGKMEEAS